LSKRLTAGFVAGWVFEGAKAAASALESVFMSEPEEKAMGGESGVPGEVTGSGQGQSKAVPDFGSKAPQGGGGMPASAWLVAGVLVVAVLVGLIIAGHRKAPAVTGIQPIAAYAENLPISGQQMSESTSLSGGKSTFVDGQIRNSGGQTVNGVTVQVLFRNDEGLPPQVETVPLMLIRTREPYVDTQTVGAAPLKPGDEREFRLIFESIPTNWNQQMPEIRIIRVDAK
jgi:hypothetical protein